jgi:hypothetical protein
VAHSLPGRHPHGGHGRVWGGPVRDRAVHLDDTSTTTAAILAVPGAAAAVRTLSFAVRPVAITNALVLTIQGNAGKVALPHPRAVAVFPDGRLCWLLGTTWRPLTGPGWVRDNVWSEESVVASRAATIYVNAEGVYRVPMPAGIPERRPDHLWRDQAGRRRRVHRQPRPELTCQPGMVLEGSGSYAGEAVGYPGVTHGEKRTRDREQRPSSASPRRRELILACGQRNHPW